MLSTLQFLHENIIVPLNETKGCHLFVSYFLVCRMRTSFLTQLPCRRFSTLAIRRLCWVRLSQNKSWAWADLDSCRIQISNIIDATELAPPRAQVCAKYISCTVVKDLFIIPPVRRAFRHCKLLPTRSPDGQIFHLPLCTFLVFLEDFVVPLQKLFSRTTTTVVDTSNSPSTPTRCNGLCLRSPNDSRKSTVVWARSPLSSRLKLIGVVNQICISACKDSQLTVEHDATLTSVRHFFFSYWIWHPIDTTYDSSQAIVDLLKSKPKASLKDVMYTAR